MNDILCALVDLATDAVRQGGGRDDVARTLREVGLDLDDDSIDAVYERAATNHVESSTPAEAKLAAAEKRIGKKVQSMQKTTVGEFLEGIYRAGLLSTLRPLQASLVGNTVSAIVEPIARVPAGLVDMLASAGTGTRSVAIPDPSQVQKRVKQVPAAFGRAFRDFVEGKSRFQSGYATNDRQINFRPMDESNPAGRAVNAATGLVSSVANRVFGLLELFDSPAREAAFQAGMYEGAVLDAKRQGITDKAGIEAHAASLMANGKFTPEMILKAVESSSNSNGPLKEIYLWAREREDEAVFANNSRATRAAASVANLPGGVLFIPFPKIPTNTVMRSLEFTPLGALYGAGRIAEAIKLAKTGASSADVRVSQRKGALALGRSVTGAGLMALGYILAETFGEDYITAPEPSNPQERQDAVTKGLTGSAVRIGDEYYTLREYPQLAALFVGASLVYDEKRRVAEETNASRGVDAREAAGSTARALFSNAMSTPILQGVDSAVSTLKEGVREKPIEEWQISRSLAGSIVPSGVTDILQAGVTERPNVTNVADAVQADLGNQNLPKRRDGMGRPITRQSGWMSQVRGISSGAKARRSDPVIREATELQIDLAPPRRNKDETPEAYQARLEIAGRLFREAALALIQEPWYNDPQTTVSQKREAWAALRRRSREVATKQSRIGGSATQ